MYPTERRVPENSKERQESVLQRTMQKKQRKTTEWENQRFHQENWRYHARMGMIKDRNGKDLTEAEEIKKRWQENTHT